MFHIEENTYRATECSKGCKKNHKHYPAKEAAFDAAQNLLQTQVDKNLRKLSSKAKYYKDKDSPLIHSNKQCWSLRSSIYSTNDDTTIEVVEHRGVPVQVLIPKEPLLCSNCIPVNKGKLGEKYKCENSGTKNYTRVRYFNNMRPFCHSCNSVQSLNVNGTLRSHYGYDFNALEETILLSAKGKKNWKLTRKKKAVYFETFDNDGIVYREFLNTRTAKDLLALKDHSSIDPRDFLDWWDDMLTSSSLNAHITLRVDFAGRCLTKEKFDFLKTVQNKRLAMRLFKAYSFTYREPSPQNTLQLTKQLILSQEDENFSFNSLPVSYWRSGFYPLNEGLAVMDYLFHGRTDETFRDFSLENKDRLFPPVQSQKNAGLYGHYAEYTNSNNINLRLTKNQIANIVTQMRKLAKKSNLLREHVENSPLLSLVASLKNEVPTHKLNSKELLAAFQENAGGKFLLEDEPRGDEQKYFNAHLNRIQDSYGAKVRKKFETNDLGQKFLDYIDNDKFMTDATYQKEFVVTYALQKLGIAKTLEILEVIANYSEGITCKNFFRLVQQGGFSGEMEPAWEILLLSR